MMKRQAIDGDRVFAIAGFLSDEECQRHIERSEAIGYETFTIDGDVFPGFRNNARVVVDDPVLAETLWSRASSFMPEIEGRPASGFNPRFRFYRYTGSEAFAPHYDGSVRLDDRASRMTFIMYLTDVPKGGETRFYGDDVKVRFSVRPRRGKALVFDHLILHEGVAVQGGTKYVLRTDVMYG